MQACGIAAKYKVKVKAVKWNDEPKMRVRVRKVCAVRCAQRGGKSKVNSSKAERCKKVCIGVKCQCAVRQKEGRQCVRAGACKVRAARRQRRVAKVL